MPNLSPICQAVYLRLGEVFGPPQTTMGHDNYWRLQLAPGALPIHVLLNGTRDAAAIWVFDVNDREVGVVSASITQVQQVDAIIRQIRERLMRASTKPGSGDRSPEASP